MRKSILDAIMPFTRQRILAATFIKPDHWWYMSELASHLNLTPSSLQRELASLSGDGHHKTAFEALELSIGEEATP